EPQHGAGVSRVDGTRQTVGRRVGSLDGLLEPIHLHQVHRGAKTLLLGDPHVHGDPIEDARRGVEAFGRVAAEATRLVPWCDPLSVEEELGAVIEALYPLSEPALGEA